MYSNITAVTAFYGQYEMTRDFLLEFKERFPNIKLVAGMLGNSSEFQQKIMDEFGKEPQFTFVTGKKDKRVSFSENWDSAINEVQTELFVFIHNDMYIHQDFFKTLEERLYRLGPKAFTLYTTVEPLEVGGMPRPGKLLAPFGQTREEFKEEKFNAFAEKAIKQGDIESPGYGFYLAGYLKSLQDTGGFDYKTFNPAFCEDDDLILRIKIKGYGIVLSRQALVYHFGSKSSRKKAGDQMSDSEIESNRRFATKWGMEARYLWECGYESEDQISIGAETVVFRAEDFLTEWEAYCIEPLIDCFVQLPSTFKSETFTYFLERGKINSEFAPDIEIEQVGPSDINNLLYLFGRLRYGHKNLKVGSEAQIGPYTVTIHNLREQDRVDNTDYLSLLKSKEL